MDAKKPIRPWSFGNLLVPIFILWLAGSVTAAPVLAYASIKTKKHLKGLASWYNRKSPGINHYTASGERFNDRHKTCASWHYRFGTKLKVRNLKNGKSVVCRVNDRGPDKRLSRVVDLSEAAFREIGNLRQGLIQVSVRKA